MKLKCPKCNRVLVYNGQSRKQHLPCPACGANVDVSKIAALNVANPVSPSADPVVRNVVDALPPDSTLSHVVRRAGTEDTESRPLAGNGNSGCLGAMETSGLRSLNEGDRSANCRSTKKFKPYHAIVLRLLRHPAIALGLSVIGLAPIYLSGVLLPVLRFVLLGSVTLAVIGFLFSFARLAVLALLPNTRPQNEGGLKSAGLACCFIAVLSAVLLFLLPSAAQNSAGSTSSPSRIPAPAFETSTVPSDTDAPMAAKVVVDVAPPSVAPPSNAPVQANEPVTRRNSDDDAARLLGALFQSAAAEQAAERERQYQQFRQGVSNLSKCPRCGGAGTYRYVDVTGNLRAATCPSCLGSGGSYGSNPMYGSP